jgi:hypothetical protein
MNPEYNRRDFLKSSAIAAMGTLAFRFEEQALAAQGQVKTPETVSKPDPQSMPRGKIGKLSVSRLICGGNLISGFAHSRDLIYVSSLLRQYFTDAKVGDTLQRCEEHGINTAILRVDEDTLRILKTYRRDRGGKIQWIAQVRISEQDMDSEIKEAVENGAVAVYVHGGVGDYYAKKNQPAALGKAIELIRQNGVLAGIAGHLVEVPIMCQKAGLKPDFYMKTFNAKSYWSAGPQERHDSVWEETPAETQAFMQTVTVPWIAYKVLGAGAIQPEEGFQFAFQNGADFICVGMFDFQISEDAALARKVLARLQARPRPWCG